MIANAIPSRNFEAIRDRIAVVLLSEIQNQIDNFELEDIDISKVWIQRTVPFEQEELPAINVSINDLEWSSKHVGHKDGNYRFNIDIYTSASYGEQEGDAKASVLCWKIVGLCDYILEHPEYKNLGFEDVKIMSSLVSNIGEQQIDRGDAESTTFGRLSYTCRSFESTSLQVGQYLQEAFSTVALNSSNKGYFWEFNNYS